MWQSSGNAEFSVLVWRNGVYVRRLHGTKRPCPMQGKRVSTPWMLFLCLGAIFCSCSINATFSETVCVRDAVDGACEKRNNRNAVAPSTARAPARSKTEPNT